MVPRILQGYFATDVAKRYPRSLTKAQGHELSPEKSRICDYQMIPAMSHRDPSQA